MPATILLTTFGSLGDLHPYLALGLELKRRGHRVTVATTEIYRQKVEMLGIGFAAVRPHLSPEDDGIVAVALEPRKGAENIIRRLVLPYLRETYEDLSRAVRGADLIVTHPLAYAAPMLVEKERIPWVSCVVSPICFFSVFDPPEVSGLSILSRLMAWGPPVARLLRGLGKLQMRSWWEPIRRMRRELGLPPDEDPFFKGIHSPQLALGLFSPLISAPQPDWPPQARVTGYAFFDRPEKGESLDPTLARFLDSGPAPIVFTLGSSAVWIAGRFYQESLAAARTLGCRAVLVVGKDPRNVPPVAPSKEIFVTGYAPFSELFPRASLIVHSAGIGTVGFALRAGRPMLAVPYAVDQPDNAARACRLGVARCLPKPEYRARRAVRELEILLGNRAYEARAAEVARRIGAEQGTQAACDAIEEALSCPISRPATPRAG